ncbi:MAG TPA: BREX system ATP-binding domain-containing protein [Chloroflexota bacterium]|nr:BREX system ATP-binding domain-containing protein [Chloroflexota bacterium]
MDEQPLDQQQARRAIEALRAGVPNRDAVSALGSAAPEIEERFQNLLSAGQEQTPEIPGPAGFLLAGNFGSGKSHLLESLQHRALAQGYITSKIVISKETPLYDPIKLFRTAIGAAVVPRRRGSALALLAEELNPRDRPFLDFYTWVQQTRPEVLNQRFAAGLNLFEDARHHDPELFERILSFWAGDPMQIGDLKRALKARGERATYLFDKIDPRGLALQRFRFAARLMLAAGYKGWVLLVDEVELIGRYGLAQRGRSYAELARWTGGIKGEAYSGLLTIFAITSDFETALLEMRHDRENVPNKLRASIREAEQALAPHAERGMRLIGRPLRVPAPNRNTVRRAFEQVRRLHGLAYGWEPPVVGSAPFATSTSMREYIRWWITEWDLKRLFPDYQPEIEATPLTIDYSEDEDLESPDEPPSHENGQDYQGEGWPPPGDWNDSFTGSHTGARSLTAPDQG